VEAVGVSLIFADFDAVSVKDSRFAAAGDSATDDTAALQAALDHCFGSIGAPHGSAGVYQNKALYVPPGHYKITAPLTVKYLHGGRIIGAGRFVTQIENTAGSSIFITNGCGYSRFEGMRLTGSAGARIFDLDWDNSAGGPALQSNTFADLFFDGGAIGIEIGRSGFMGSENLFLNCFWLLCSTAGLLTSNANAVQQTVIGGNFQTCGTAIFVGTDRFPRSRASASNSRRSRTSTPGPRKATRWRSPVAAAKVRISSTTPAARRSASRVAVTSGPRTDIFSRKPAGSVRCGPAIRRAALSFRSSGGR
jgi:hypothetical protein